MDDPETNGRRDKPDDDNGKPDPKNFIHNASTTPEDKSPSAPQAKAQDQSHPSAPSEVFKAIASWLNHYWDAPRKKSRWTETITVILTFVIAGAAFVSALIFQGQLTETQKATALAELDFRRDERAWIEFKFSEGSITFTLNKPFLVPTEIVNTGKTPARKVHGNIVVGVFPKGVPLDFSYTRGRTAHYAIRAGTIFPNGGIKESFEAVRHGKREAKAIIFNASLKKNLWSAQSFLVVYGKIEYLDIFGNLHWTSYCRYVLHPEMISPQCMAYNDTDSDP